MRTLRSGFAVLAVGAAIITLAFSGCLALLAFTDEDPQFLVEEAGAIGGTPGDARVHLANIGHWALWRTKLRSQPPTDYEFHRLIKLISETIEPESFSGTTCTMTLSLVEPPPADDPAVVALIAERNP